MNQKVRELKEEIFKSTTVVGDSNMPLLVIKQVDRESIRTQET